MSEYSPRPVIAVIPHFNMPQTLVPLLYQTLEQDYTATYVLDDDSSNCNIEEVLKPFGSKVTLIAGEENVGAGRNRNRILEADSKRLAGSILHFMDADVQLLTKDAPIKARRALTDASIGEVGGLIVNADGLQYMHNYNPRISLSWCFKVALQGAVGALAGHRPALAKNVHGLLADMLAEFPNLFTTPVERDVWCVSEANILVPYDTFAAVGGFSEKLRFQEAQDFAYRLEDRGLRRHFNPSISVRHLAVQVRGKKRNFENIQGVRTVAKQHGFPKD